MNFQIKALGLICVTFLLSVLLYFKLRNIQRSTQRWLHGDGHTWMNSSCTVCHFVCFSGLITPGGFSSVPAGMETPELIELRKKKIEEAMDG